MDLEELQKRLYEQKEGWDKRETVPGAFEPGQDQAGPGGQPADWEKEPTVRRQPFFTESRKKIFKFIGIGLAATGILGGGILFVLGLFSFDSSRVYLAVFGRDRIVSGEEISYVVRWRNDTKVVLKDVKLTFIYPDGSLPFDKENLTMIGNQPASVVDLSDVVPGQEEKMEFRAYVSGLKDDIKKAQAKLNYHPANISSGFENLAEFSSEIFSVPLVLDFDMPERVVSGQNLGIALKYLNTADVAFSNLILNVEYPAGFDFKSASPSPDQGENSWQLSEIGPREEGKILISGVLGGSQDEVKNFKAKIVQQQGELSRTVSEGLASTLISVSPLSVELSINNSRDFTVSLGDQLNYKIKYQNTANVQLGPVYIIVKFDTKALDFSTLKTDGFFNSFDNTITWNESVLPGLKLMQPGEQKMIEFYLKAKDKLEKLPIANFNDKNLLINISAEIDSKNIPISLRGTQISGSDSLSGKLNSKLAVSARGYYKDNLMPNSGPIPPVVGQQTTYTIYWGIINSPNEADNVTVESYLPPYVTWLNKFDPADADVKYDKNSGKISWTLGKVAANTGVLLAAKRLAFQIGFTPSSVHAGDKAVLVEESKVSGLDTFTGIFLENIAKKIMTDLPDDPWIEFGYEQGKVRY
jgi:hypothetical protein